MSLTPEAIQTLVTGEHGDPFAVLGPHASRDGSVIVRALLPRAPAGPGRTPPPPLPPPSPRPPPVGRAGRAGRGGGGGAGPLPLAYRGRGTDGAGHVADVEDPYRSPPTL